jgi:hypothetical protein
MKIIKERAYWYRQAETRRWKRVVHCAELLIILLSAIAIIAIMQNYGDGTQFQFVFCCFVSAIALSATSLVPSFYTSTTLKRWQIQMITLGLGCGMGVSALAGLVILELQLSNI